MVQPTHNRKSDHLVPCILSGRNRSALFRDLLPNPLMRPCLVEVHHIRIEHTLELLLMKNQQMVETCLPYTPGEALADRIGSGGVIRRLEQLDTTGRCHPEEIGSKLAIIITYQILGSLPIGSRFPERYGPPSDRKAIA
jgi:hypothetical protein